MTTLENRPKHRRSSIVDINYETDAENKSLIRSAKGTCYWGGVLFRFTLNRVTGAYPLRGTLSAVNPEGNGVMRMLGQAKAEQKKKYFPDREPTKKEEYEYLAIKHTIRLKTAKMSDRKMIENEIESAVKALYAKHIESITKNLKETIAPSTITPVLACGIYLQQFLAADSGISKNKAETIVSYRDSMTAFFSFLPVVPMHTVTTKDITSALRNAKIKPHVQRAIRRFWGYCMLERICLGMINPVPEPQRRRKDSKKLRDAAFHLDKLSARICQKIEQVLESSEELSSDQCGILLMLYGRLEPKDIEMLQWRHVIWGGDEDYVCIPINKPEQAGWTHDFTRPLLPPAARALRARYKALFTRYSEEVLASYPLVSQLSDPSKPMTAAALIQRATEILKSVGVSEKTFAYYRSKWRDAAARRLLFNTYDYMIDQLTELDAGSRRYLKGLPMLQDTTHDNYVSMSDEEGRWRLYQHLRHIGAPKKLSAQEPIIADGWETHTITPGDSAHRVSGILILEFESSLPFELIADQGIEADIKVREILKDGTIRRKKRSKS